ncbi:terminase large subunit domain-containing protein [Scytonema sp. PCC 10023]|uniref:terminase large subunit domain-containing protein n=1 Tax=Scytonema sp. PCC 10023 TaxID=1680591 RepID=UPI0039C68B50
MAISLSKIRKLEAKLKKRNQELSLQKTNLKLPNNWEDFVALTTIRSGGEMKKFELYEYQKIMIELASKYPSMVILKSRQMGITQAIVAKFLYDACTNKAASSILFMRNAEDASAISRRARQMLSSISEYAQADNDSVGYLKIKGGGDLYFKNSGKEGSRSLDSCTGMLFDEAAFVENIQQIYAASNPSSALSGNNIQKFIVSTPSSKSGFYWDKLNENNDDIDIEKLADDVAKGNIYRKLPGVYWFIDKAGSCKLILHWKAHPIYSQIPNYLEYRLKQDGTDEEVVAREYDLRFIDSTVSVFDSGLIRLNAIGQYENTVDKDAIYYAGLDTSTVGSDYCTCPILKYKEGKYSLVNLYRKRQQTSEYHLYQIGELLKIFKPKITGVEVTGGVGRVYQEQLIRQFPNLEFQGIYTSQDSKALMISAMVLALEKQILTYPNTCPLVNEMLSFRRDGKKLEAAPGKHDDTVMGVAFALAVSPFNKEKKPFIDVSKIKVWNGK